MRFRRIAVFFLLFANILMLAHSIIPHHHHSGLVISSNAPCCNNSGNHKINDHSHDNGDDTYCALKQEILIPGRSIRSGADQQNENPEEPFFQDINIIILISRDPVYNSCCSSLDHHQYGLSHYLFLLNNSRGLRAPPLS
ncbi:MAG: hypothetical protein C0408_02140 [Odoribacter sp.]|nr:hypothetical protein [Odoribacter sp.]